MKLWMMAWADIRKKRGMALSMCVLILLSTALFHMGLMLLGGVGHFYEIRNEELVSPHYVVRFSGDGYQEDYLDYLVADSRVEAAEAEEMVSMDMASYMDGGALTANFINLDRERKIKGFQLKEMSDVPREEAVYLPLFMKEIGYDPGSEFTVKFKKKLYTFTVAGYYEATWFNSSVSTICNFYLHDEAYEKLYRELGNGYLLSVRLFDSSQTEALRTDFKAQTDVGIEAITIDAAVMDFTIGEMKNGTTMLVKVIASVLFAFAFIIAAVVMLVIRFRIVSHVESQLPNIGALKAMGYTGRHIRLYLTEEFGAIGAVGCALGLIGSYAGMKGMGNLITSSMGVTWRNVPQVGFCVLSVVLIMAVVAVTAYLSASRAALIPPIQALRGGIETHSFQKNHFPLEKTRLHVSLALALKSMVFQKKTDLMLGVIFAGVMFASGFAAVTYDNMGRDSHIVDELSGYEASDILAYTAVHADYDEVAEKIRSMDGVRKTALFETDSVYVNDNLITCYISDAFTELESIHAYEGNLPVYENEIALTGVLADSLGVRLGDEVKVRAEGVETEYVVCGFCQTLNNFGRQCYLSLSGIRRIRPAYHRKSIQIYLEPGLEPGAFISDMEKWFRVVSPSVEEESEAGGVEAARKRAEEKIANLLSMYGVDSVQYALMVDGELLFSGDTLDYELDHLENTREMLTMSVDSMKAAAVMMSVVIAAGTLCVISLVLYMVVKSTILKRRYELGIYKALGYTNGQLMRQVAAGFLPPFIAGVAVGGAAATLFVNPMMGGLLRGMGVSRLAFTINPVMMAGLGLAVVAAGFLISLAVASQVRKISVYSLLTE